MRLVDYGIRGMHLLYDLLDGYDALVMVDACPAAAGPVSWSCSRSGPTDLGGCGGEFDPTG